MNWGEIVRKVEKANIGAVETEKEEKNARKEAYLRALDSQVEESLNRADKARCINYEERKSIQQAAQAQGSHNKLWKYSKIKTEQNYQQENQMLIRSKMKLLENSRKSDSVSPQHPFIKLVDEQNMRKELTRERMKHQNTINDKQLEIKNSRLAEKHRIEAEAKRAYQQHVEGLFAKRESDRKKFVQRYLKIKPNEAQALGIGELSPNINKAYQDVALKQLQINSRRKEVVDGQLKNLNASVDQGDSSPAYLGRNPGSYDRRRQLQIIDKTIFNGPADGRLPAIRKRTISNLDETAVILTKEEDTLLSHASEFNKIISPGEHKGSGKYSIQNIKNVRYLSEAPKQKEHLSHQVSVNQPSFFSSFDYPNIMPERKSSNPISTINKNIDQASHPIVGVSRPSQSLQTLQPAPVISNPLQSVKQVKNPGRTFLTYDLITGQQRKVTID